VWYTVNTHKKDPESLKGRQRETNAARCVSGQCCLSVRKMWPWRRGTWKAARALWWLQFRREGKGNSVNVLSQ